MKAEMHRCKRGVKPEHGGNENGNGGDALVSCCVRNAAVSRLALFPISHLASPKWESRWGLKIIVILTELFSLGFGSFLSEMLHGECIITWLNKEITLKRVRIVWVLPQAGPWLLKLWYLVCSWSLPEAEASSCHLCTCMPHFTGFSLSCGMDSWAWGAPGSHQARWRGSQDAGETWWVLGSPRFKSYTHCALLDKSQAPLSFWQNQDDVNTHTRLIERGQEVSAVIVIKQ